ncbi:MAG: LL-diaminopimelate aminotransferase [bacterium]
MDIHELFAERIGGRAFGSSTAIYKFEKIKRAKAAVRKAYPDIELLDFGVGEPDELAPRSVRQALKKAVDDPANRGYADNGIPQFKSSAAQYMKDFFGVDDIDPETEINHSIGSKPALAMIPLCFINPGDVAIVTVPGYPVLATHVRYLGGTVVKVPLLRENGFLPALNAIDPAVAKKAKLFYVNYPNNPTGASATPEFFDRLIAFARANNILIVHDAAYATLAFGAKPLSILSRPGGREVAIELHSMSKCCSMTGWRLGFVAGNPLLVQAFAEVKDNIDSGQFKAIQLAACAGLADRKAIERTRRHYEKRLRKMVSVLKSTGFDVKMPGGTFYLYTQAPKGAGSQQFSNAEEASQHLILKHLISTVPWDDVGAFLRFSATFESKNARDDDRVIAELGSRLRSADLRF